MDIDRSGGRSSARAVTPAPLILEKRVVWCEDADAALARAVGSDRDTLAEGVAAGRVELWRCNAGAAWMVTRVEDGELIVCCLQGAGLAEMAPLIYRIAQSNKLRQVRFFSESFGVSRILRKAGFRAQCIGHVFTVGIDHVSQ